MKVTKILTLFGLNNRAVTSAVNRLDKEANRTGLVVNEGKAVFKLDVGHNFHVTLSWLIISSI